MFSQLSRRRFSLKKLPSEITFGTHGEKDFNHMGNLFSPFRFSKKKNSDGDAQRRRTFAGTIHAGASGPEAKGAGEVVARHLYLAPRSELAPALFGISPWSPRLVRNARMRRPQTYLRRRPITFLRRQLRRKAISSKGCRMG